MDVALVLTHDCNLGCPYCYTGEKFGKRMSRDVAEKALTFASQLDTSEKIQISYFGGEPFMAFPAMKEFTTMARSIYEPDGRRLKFVVTTNGTYLNERRLDYLRENEFYVGLSIDGVKEAHDASRPLKSGGSSWNAVVAGLRSLIRSGVDFETISVVDPSNVAHLTETVAFLLDAGVRRISLNPNFEGDWSDEDLELWAEGYRGVAKLWQACYRRGHLVYVNVVDDNVITHLKDGYKVWDHCEFGKGAIAVAPSGNIYPCERMVGEDRDHKYCIGNVFDGFSARRNFLIGCSGNHNEECGDCAMENRCMGWCACANLADSGKINQPGGLLCWHEQTSLDIADAAAAELYKEQNAMFLQNYYLR